MSYPSLLFTEKASGQRVESHVFEDVKLTLLFSEEAIGAMRVLCRPEDIPVRQELLRFLWQQREARESLQTLAQIAAEINRLRDALEIVKCENERHYVYIGLMAAVADFYNRAAMLPENSGSLLSRFGGWFRSAKDEAEWKALSGLALELREKAEAARKESFRMEGDNLWMRPDFPESYVERLKRCAVDLGLPETRSQRDTSIRLDARMVNALARLHPEAFLAFRDFYAAYGEKFDESILSYRFELNFYLEALNLMDRIQNAGLPLCWPKPCPEKKLHIIGLRDISLLTKGSEIIPNNADFTETEPFFFLTGANGGGKTTYLRALAIGTLLYLAGCPVCAEQAEIWPFQNVFTHFPQDERFEADGRYADELKRTAEILRLHGGSSLILLNETYSTTNEELAVSSTLELTEKLKDSGSFTLYITHQHGLESAGVPFLSVIVDSDNQNRRTYRIARRKEAAGSYAADILRRYALDRDSLQKRFSAGKGEQV